MLSRPAVTPISRSGNLHNPQLKHSCLSRHGSPRKCPPSRAFCAVEFVDGEHGLSYLDLMIPGAVSSIVATNCRAEAVRPVSKLENGCLDNLLVGFFWETTLLSVKAYALYVTNLGWSAVKLV